MQEMAVPIFASKIKEVFTVSFYGTVYETKCNIPHGVPNPMLEECRRPLINQVLLDGADMGVAWGW